MHIVTKSYWDLPAAHRQPNHDGHCRLIHGHNWGFDITFTCDSLDENGFVIDVGKLGEVKEMLEYYFDHTLLLNQEDPLLPFLRRHLLNPEDPRRNLAEVMRDQIILAEIREVPNCGMEGLAEFVFKRVAALAWMDLSNQKRKVRVIRVICWEDGKNSATYTA